MELPSLTPVSIAGWGRLQLGVVYWVTSAGLLQVVNNNIDPQTVVVESPLRDYRPYNTLKDGTTGWDHPLKDHRPF